jgi:hypothetical protein
MLLSIGFAGAEIYARQSQGDKIFSLFNQKNNYFWEGDKVKIWNKRYVENNPWYFDDWPIPLEVFASNISYPQYLFKPNMKMTLHGPLQGPWTLDPAKPGETVYWSSDSWGFRGPEFQLKKPPGTIRIVCLGASTTEGLITKAPEASTDATTYPYLLQEELRQIFGDKVEVINAGHEAQQIDDLLEVLRQRVLPLKPDIVVFYEANNNLWLNDFARNLACHPAYYQKTEGTPCWLLAYPGWYSTLYERSGFFTMISNGLGWSTSKPPPMPHELDLSEGEGPRILNRTELFAGLPVHYIRLTTTSKPSTAHFISVLREIAIETLRHNSTIVLSSFVTVAHEGLEVSYDENPSLFNDLYHDHYPFTPGELAEIYDYVNRQIAALALDLQVPFADVAANYPRDKRYFCCDIIHFTPEGNRILAKSFAQFLATAVLPKMGVIPVDQSTMSCCQPPAMLLDDQRRFTEVISVWLASKGPRLCDSSLYSLFPVIDQNCLVSCNS